MSVLDCRFSRILTLFCIVLAVLASGLVNARAQAPTPGAGQAVVTESGEAAGGSSDSAIAAEPSAEVAEAALPDAPAPQQSGSTQQKPDMAATRSGVATTGMMVAPMYSDVIPAGEATPQIHGRDKYVLATRDLYSLTTVAGFIVSAGWSHLTNGQPNYGTNSEAFAQRVGASAVRDTTQAFLSDGPFAVMLHQDPRYFELGPQHSIVHRAWYAATRAIITRNSSDGRPVFNSSLILGQAAGTALNNLYYPQSNRNFHDNLAGFGGSVGGAALSFVFDEFYADLLHAVHLRERH